MVRKERKMPKNAQNSSQKPNFSALVQFKVPWPMYSPWHAFRDLVHLLGLPV